MRRLIRVVLGMVALAMPGALVVFWTGQASAQNPVLIGGPLTGEVVLNRDVEVRIAPQENARIVMTLDKGKPLNALGTPRGTLWTQVAIGGQPIGYVPADSLDPALAIRPLPLPAPAPARPAMPAQGGMAGSAPDARAAINPGVVAALVPRAAWERGQNARARGYVVALADIAWPPPDPDKTKASDKKKAKAPAQGPAMSRGMVAGLLDVVGDQARVIVPGGGRHDVPVSQLIGVLTGYPLPGQAPLGTGPLYAARLGEYITYEEGRRAWDVFVQGPGGGFRAFPPMVWPVFAGPEVVYQMGIGPFNAGELDNICPLLARGGFACAIMELARF